MSNFGELVLVLGDLHIPDRATKIAAPIQRMLVPNKMQHVICTGNVSPESLSELQQLAPNLHCVAGDYDLDTPFPETLVVQVGAFRIGILHGHQLIPWNSREAVQRMRRKLQVDILITGHTHRSEVVVDDDGFCHINPGSITGAYSAISGDNEDVAPSFILLAVQEAKVVCYVYELVNGAVDVSKTEFTKSAAISSSNPALLDGLLK